MILPSMPQACLRAERKDQAQNERGELLVPGSTLCAGRCALCWEAFRLGDSFSTVWPKRGPRLALTLHPACRAQLDPGDLGKLFDSLARGLALPLARLRLAGAGEVLKGARR
jgi:hypothetical protein